MQIHGKQRLDLDPILKQWLQRPRLSEVENLLRYVAGDRMCANLCVFTHLFMNINQTTMVCCFSLTGTWSYSHIHRAQTIFVTRGLQPCAFACLFVWGFIHAYICFISFPHVFITVSCLHVFLFYTVASFLFCNIIIRTWKEMERARHRGRTDTTPEIYLKTDPSSFCLLFEWVVQCRFSDYPHLMCHRGLGSYCNKGNVI